MHPQVTLIAAQQHIADLHRAADHNRLGHTATTATTATSRHAVPAPRDAAVLPVSFLRWLRRHAAAAPVSFLPPEDQAGDCK
jgi:hypothetical protein